MQNFTRLFSYVVLLFFMSSLAYAQEDVGFSSELDSARAAEDNKKDSVIFTAKYVRYTTLAAMKKYVHTTQIDTTHYNFQYYNPQNQPWNPSINLGAYGTATRDLLFTPNKTIGFQSGYHALDRLLILSDSVKYYRARARYSELYAVGFFFEDQIFRAKVAQNINPRLNIGAEYHAANTDGFYQNQQYNDRKGSLFSWYESESNRYNLLTNFTFNNLNSPENGSIVNDNVFVEDDGRGSYSQIPKLSGRNADRPFNKWNDYGFFVRQSYFVGRIDTVNKNLPEQEIHPTNVIAHNTSLRSRSYIFRKNEDDVYGVFPTNTVRLASDTTHINTISNDFSYSFYLRSKTLKNEARLELGFLNDLIWYDDSLSTAFYQNNMVKGKLGYQFSDRVDFNLSVDQVILGANFGDYLYEAAADVALGDRVGTLRIGAYSQNKSPEMLFTRANLTYHQWERDLSKTKTQNLSFSYNNPLLGFSGKAEYFLMDNYLYFKEVDNPTNLSRLRHLIEPAQSGAMNLLKVSIGQNFKFRNFHLDNLVVYQKSDQMDILATPELYIWHSFYYGNILSKVMDFRIGMDVKFNTPFRTPSYSINSGQFFYDNVGIEFSTYPIADLWVTANIKRVNLFLSYNYVNQHLYPKGFYTVRRYPMYDANFRFGVSWKFYD